MNRQGAYLAGRGVMHTSIMKNCGPDDRARQRWVTIVLAAICLGVAVYSIQWLDIGLYDETAYLQRGAVIDEEGLPSADMGPLYSLWYRVLQVVWADPIDRYFANLGITIALLPFMLFLVLRRLGTSLIVSSFVALFILVSTLNILNWPRVSVFALIILLLGLWLQAGSRSRDRGWAFLTCAAIIAVYIRPEFALSVGILGVSWLVDLYRRKRRGEPYSITPIMTTAVLAITMSLVLGNPFGHGRGMVAFGQHYALNRIEADDSDTDAWTSWETITQRDLGTTSSLSRAVSHAPDRVAWHIGSNLRQLVPTLGRMVLPAGARLDRKATVLLGLLFFVICWALFLARKAKRSTSVASIWVIAALAAPAILAAIVIFPRQHYLIFPITLATLPLVATLFPERSVDTRWPHRIAAVLTVFILLTYVGRPIGTPGRPVLATIQALRELDLPAPMIILDADGGYATYLPAGSVRISAQDKVRGLDDLLSTERINVIVASQRLAKDPRFAEDPDWRHFVDGGYTTRFDRSAVEGTNTLLYVLRARPH